jgi:hypothetical protein
LQELDTLWLPLQTSQKSADSVSPVTW